MSSSQKATWRSGRRDCSGARPCCTSSDLLHSVAEGTLTGNNVAHRFGLKKSGSEWLHRVLWDPRRLTSRYLIECPWVSYLLKGRKSWLSRVRRSAANVRDSVEGRGSSSRHHQDGYSQTSRPSRPITVVSMWSSECTRLLRVSGQEGRPLNGVTCGIVIEQVPHRIPAADIRPAEIARNDCCALDASHDSIVDRSRRARSHVQAATGDLRIEYSMAFSVSPACARWDT